MLYIFYFLVCMISKKKKQWFFCPFLYVDKVIFQYFLCLWSFAVWVLYASVYLFFFFSLAFLIICEYPESVVWFMSLILESSQQLLHHIFLPLCSFFLPHLRYQLYIWNCHTVLVCSIHSFFYYFFILVWEDFIDISSSSLILYSAIPKLGNIPRFLKKKSIKSERADLEWCSWYIVIWNVNLQSNDKL